MRYLLMLAFVALIACGPSREPTPIDTELTVTPDRPQHLNFVTPNGARVELKWQASAQVDVQLVGPGLGDQTVNNLTEGSIEFTASGDDSLYVITFTASAATPSEVTVEGVIR